MIHSLPELSPADALGVELETHSAFSEITSLVIKYGPTSTEVHQYMESIKDPILRELVKYVRDAVGRRIDESCNNSDINLN